MAEEVPDPILAALQREVQKHPGWSATLSAGRDVTWWELRVTRDADNWWRSVLLSGKEQTEAAVCRMVRVVIEEVVDQSPDGVRTPDRVRKSGQVRVRPPTRRVTRARRSDAPRGDLYDEARRECHRTEALLRGMAMKLSAAAELREAGARLVKESTRLLTRNQPVRRAS